MDDMTLIAIAALCTPFWSIGVVVVAYLAASACKGINAMFDSAAKTQMMETTSPQTTHQA